MQATFEVMMNTNLQVRPATIRDLPNVLRLNQSVVPHVSNLTLESLRSLFDEAAWFGIATIEGASAGFVIVLRPGATYQSENYLWFSQRFANFLYIDRVCVAQEFQRRGVASFLYAETEKTPNARAS